MQTRTQDPALTLLIRYQKYRDSSALVSLVEMWHPAAFRAASCITQQKELAEEAVQDAFMALASGEARFTSSGSGSCKSWFIGMVLNRARMARRSERRAQKRKSIHESDYRVRMGAANEPGPDSNKLEILNGLIGELDEVLRIPVVMRYGSGIKQKEIASLLNVSQQTVSQRIERGLNKLRYGLVKSGLGGWAEGVQRDGWVVLAAGSVPTPAGLLSRVLNTAGENQPLYRDHPERAYQKSAHSDSEPATSGQSGPAGRMVLKGVALTASTLVCLIAWSSSTSQSPADATNAGKNESVPLEKKTVIQATPLRVRWEFSNGPAPDLRTAFGTWRWENRKEKKGNMAVPKDEHVMVSLPFKVPAMPWKITVHFEPFDRNQFASCGAFYDFKRGYFGFNKWTNRVKIHPYPSNAELFGIGNYCFSLFNGRIQTMRRYREKVPKDSLMLHFGNARIQWIEFQSLTLEDLPKTLQTPQDVPARLGLTDQGQSPDSFSEFYNNPTASNF